jgi:diadenosine tetraphosphate (Ap4A) HIT family hydrolase
MSPCPVCEKHQDLSKHTGPAIFDDGGWLVTHFPKLETEKATRGHLLIESKRHVQDLTELNDVESATLGRLIRDGAKLIKTKTEAEHVYCFRINDKVQHLHFHLIPRYPNTPKEFWGINIMSCTTSPKLSTLEEIQNFGSLFV